MKSNYLIPISIVVAGFLIAMALFFSQSGGGAVSISGDDENRAAANERQNQERSNVIVPDEDDDPVLGNPDALITLIEFGDYECPFCGQFFSQTLPQIKKEYVDTGKVKLVYRDFPLSTIHPNAQKAAEAAECVRASGGNYWTYHDLLYENTPNLEVAALKQYAASVSGINMSQFNNCLDSGQFEDEVKSDFQAAVDGGGRGTPFFIINGQTLVGAQPFANFKQVFDSILEN